MAACCVLMFLAGSPYLLLDHGRALHDLRSLQASTSMGMTPPELLGRGWTYHLPHSLWYGVGWPMLISALAGLVWMAGRHPGPALVLGSFPVAYYVAAGAGYNVFVRYMLPVVPFLCIFAGYFVASAASAIAPAMRLRPALVAAALGLAVAAPPAINVVQFDRLLTREDSRIVAGRWLAENVPAGASMFISGNRYGHPALDFARYRQFGFDYRGSTFTADRRPTSELPQWLVIQRAEIPVQPRARARREADRARLSARSHGAGVFAGRAEFLRRPGRVLSAVRELRSGGETGTERVDLSEGMRGPWAERVGARRTGAGLKSRAANVGEKGRQGPRASGRPD